MENDCQSRMNKDVLKRLDDLKFVNRKLSYSKRVKILLDFCDKFEGEYEKWMKKQEKTKN